MADESSNAASPAPGELQTEGSTQLTMAKLGLADIEDGAPLLPLTEDFRDEWELEKEDPEGDEEELERTRKGWKAGILNVSCTGRRESATRQPLLLARENDTHCSPRLYSFAQVWRQIAGHKDANLFRHPVKAEHAPGYYDVR